MAGAVNLRPPVFVACAEPVRPLLHPRRPSQWPAEALRQPLFPSIKRQISAAPPGPKPIDIVGAEFSSLPLPFRRIHRSAYRADGRFRGKLPSSRTCRGIRYCEGFRMPAADGDGTGSGGRRPKASSGRNRDGEWMAVPRALWGFGHSGARGGVSVRRWMAKVVGLRMRHQVVVAVVKVFADQRMRIGATIEAELGGLGARRPDASRTGAKANDIGAWRGGAWS